MQVVRYVLYSIYTILHVQYIHKKEHLIKINIHRFLYLPVGHGRRLSWQKERWPLSE
jgi:hypothetical protein